MSFQQFVGNLGIFNSCGFITIGDKNPSTVYFRPLVLYNVRELEIFMRAIVRRKEVNRVILSYYKYENNQSYDYSHFIKPMVDYIREENAFKLLSK